MSINPSSPAHVEELVEACSMRINNPETADRMLVAARGIASTGATLAPAFAAHVTLSSPSHSASLLRALLERCGVEVEDTYGIGRHVSLLTVCDVLRAGVDVRMSDLPALILALLDIPADAQDRRERAMAALKEHGR